MNTIPADLSASIALLTGRAKSAARVVAISSGQLRNQALRAIAHELEKEKANILTANVRDLAQGTNLADSLKDRLTITDKGFSQMMESLHQVAELPDPIGGINHLTVRPSGIRLGKMRVPLGVVGMIYESRPNVTQEASALCLKSGNACVLRGGSEALHSNLALLHAIHAGLKTVGLPTAAVSLIPTAERAAVSAMLQSPDIDVLIPRGGKALIQKVMGEARMPVIKHLDGNCHVYINTEANIDMAVNIADNAKTQRYGTCNTAEGLIVDRAIAPTFLPKIAQLYQAKGVEIRGCVETRLILTDAKIAIEEDYYTEYLAPIISVKVVENIDEAIAHINLYGSHHTDVIVTENYSHAMRFLREVDSASVMVNASTRFADGFEYGLGAEIGISTDKFHARGPVGLEGLTSEKWVVLGSGEIRG